MGAEAARQAAPVGLGDAPRCRRSPGEDAGDAIVPSGHAASAFAFAAGVAAEAPQAGLALIAAGAVVAYSRVHTGVHYPGDVIAGSLTGAAVAPVAVTALRRRGARRSGRGARRV
jgi:undecaprenyl-diphosphatase